MKKVLKKLALVAAAAATVTAIGAATAPSQASAAQDHSVQHLSARDTGWDF